MNETAHTPVGQALREAREAQGLGVEDVAARLRLMHRQIEAMETGDFDSLGQPVFARGFVRNYARLLGLAPEPLLAGMAGTAVEPVVVLREAPKPARNWLTSPWLLLSLAGLLVLASVPVALYWWLNSDEEEFDLPRAAITATLPATPESTAVTPVKDPAESPAGAPVSAESAADSGSSPAQSAAEAPLAETSAELAAPAAPARGVLQMEFGAESWVEIRDGSRRMLHRQLNPPGRSVTVRGEPPFDLVIGNAAQVHLTYNGRPIDLKPFVDVTVARFTLEE